jgi:hypothetical protein
LVGAFLFGILSNGLNLMNVPSFWQQRIKGETGQIPLLAASVAMIVIVGIAIVIIAWKRFGILQDMTL